MPETLLPVCVRDPMQLSNPYLFGGEERTAQEATLTGGSLETVSGKRRALVVDDVPDVTEMIALFLEHAGYEAVMAYSAPDALAAARTDRFDIVVSDIGMPGMNGYELAEALRALPEYRTIPIIAVTGFSAYDDGARALRAGFNAHLTKPINPMSLLEIIEKLREI